MSSLAASFRRLRHQLRLTLLERRLQRFPGDLRLRVAAAAEHCRAAEVEDQHLDRWVLVVRVMHPSLSAEPWRFFARAWTRRSCFETWDEDRQRRLTEKRRATRGAAGGAAAASPGEVAVAV
eukprot:Skav202615  [mRNA]  locus=scaffold3002:95481:105768:+ [translate_table: standard]